MNAALRFSSQYALRRLGKIPDFSVATVVAVALAVLFIASPVTSALAGESDLRTYGDPSLQTLVDARTRVIYEALSDPESQHLFLMTRGNPMSLKNGIGTEATCILAQGALSRIVATVWTKKGKYSVEFYRDGGTLIMVYETFTFFEESAPRGAWRNFMGLAAWERRVYFDGHRIGYAEARGLQAPVPGTGGEQLQEQALHLAELLRKR